MTVSMTWPQYCRREATINGRVVHMSGRKADVLCMLLLGDPEHFLPRDHFLEAFWPNPDDEPESASTCWLRVYITRLGQLGVPIESRHRDRASLSDRFGGYRIPAWARGRPENARLAA